MNRPINKLRAALPLCAVTALTAFTLVCNPVLAQVFPTKPIHITIGFPPGNVLDADTRAIGGEMQKTIGQPVIVEYKPGANATIAAKYVAGSAPDGYNLLYGTATSFHPIFNANNAVVAGTDLTPVSYVSAAPYVYYISGKVPATNIRELQAHAKTLPDGITGGVTSGMGEFSMQMLRERTGIASRIIPYKAQPQVLPALLSGELDSVFSGVGPFLPHIQSGGIRPLFVTASKRLFLLPDVPTAAEAGVANMEFYANYGIWAPPKTPRDVVLKLSGEIGKAVRVPAVTDQIRRLTGAEPLGLGPDELMRIFETETRLWGDAARKANFKPQ